MFFLQLVSATTDLQLLFGLGAIVSLGLLPFVPLSSHFLGVPGSLLLQTPGHIPTSTTQGLPKSPLVSRSGKCNREFHGFGPWSRRTCHRATKPVLHSYCSPQALEPVLLRREIPAMRGLPIATREESSLAATRETLRAAMKT